jgi:hypothetical protein
MTRVAFCRAVRIGICAWILAARASAAGAEDRYALIVSGAAGGQEYVQPYRQIVGDLTKVLVERLKFDPSKIATLSDSDRPAAAATADAVRRAIATVRQSMTRDDVLIIMLIGHGTFDGVDAKFNLVGPDLESSEWAALLKPLPGRLVIVNTTAGSFPFLERLAGPRRVVITATDSASQRFDTVFAQYFVKALGDPAADLDKNGRISIWETFAAASAAVRRHYQQRGQLSTERALIDDNGDGLGKESIDPGDDGSYASRTYLDEALPGAAPTDEVLLRLLQRKATLEAEVDDLRIRKTFLTPSEYAAEFERIMIELARVSHDIRTRTKS